MESRTLNPFRRALTSSHVWIVPYVHYRLQSNDEDLISVGHTALVHAAISYRPRRHGQSFRRYAILVVRRAMLKALQTTRQWNVLDPTLAEPSYELSVRDSIWDALRTERERQLSWRERLILRLVCSEDWTQVEVARQLRLSRTLVNQEYMRATRVLMKSARRRGLQVSDF